MKKIAFSLFAASLAMVATSCSNDIDLEAPSASDAGNVTLSVQLPHQFNTRAYGDGFTAQTLRYVVYETGKPYPVYVDINGIDNVGKYMRYASFDPMSHSTNLTLQLVNGKSYEIFFWADNDAAAYAFDPVTKTVTVNYGAVNDENRDAFYASYSTGVISGPVNDEVELKRPFAQVNLGTDDLDAAEVIRVFGENAQNLQTSVTTRAYTTLNLADGSVDGEQEVTLTQAAIPTGIDAEFPINPTLEELNPYKRIQMHYLLVPQDDSSVADFTFFTHVGTGEALPNPVQVTNVPLQANFRTNIYGSILTNPVNITVTKNPDWSLPDYEVKEWKGGSETALAQMIAKGGNVVIAANVANLDLSSYSAEAPLCLNLEAGVDRVKLGAFTQPVTIVVAKDVKFPTLYSDAGVPYQNLTIVGDLNTKAPAKQIQFIRSIKNVTLKNIVFDGEGTVQYGAGEYGNSIEDMVIEGCVFSNYTVAPISFQGGNGKKNITVKDCTVNIGSGASSSANGVYCLDFEDIAVTGCTINDAQYHGIFVRAANSVEVTGNKVNGANEDGIKIEGAKGAKQIVCTGNNLRAKCNGIRVKDALYAENITITGNTVDMSEANEFSETKSEPWGILLQKGSSAQVSTPVVVVKNNIKVGDSSYWFSNQYSVAASSDIATPFK